MCKMDLVNECNIGGSPLYWASSIETWSIQKDGSPLRHISAETLREVVENAFARWAAADCGDGTIPRSPFRVPGRQSVHQLRQARVQQVATERERDHVPRRHWPYTESGAETLALTTVYFNPTDGEIFDANVEINSNLQQFALADAEYPAADLNAVLTHELGHFLGLSHSNIMSATMYSNYDEGMKTLEDDDVQAICKSLPPDRATTDSDLPRHGFSGDCSVAEKGCCSSTIGGPVPDAQRLGVWAFGLGLCAFLARGRGRLRRSGRALRR